MPIRHTTYPTCPILCTMHSIPHTSFPFDISRTAYPISHAIYPTPPFHPHPQPSPPIPRGYVCPSTSQIGRLRSGQVTLERMLELDARLLRWILLRRGIRLPRCSDPKLLDSTLDRKFQGREGDGERVAMREWPRNCVFICLFIYSFISICDCMGVFTHIRICTRLLVCICDKIMFNPK